jgi:hypothetical protein
MLSPEKAAANKRRALEVLRERCVPFALNDSNVLLVDSVWDFIPATGWFFNRETKKVGRGIWNLLSELKRRK